jgi:hypothetical protein
MEWNRGPHARKFLKAGGRHVDRGNVRAHPADQETRLGTAVIRVRVPIYRSWASRVSRRIIAARCRANGVLPGCGLGSSFFVARRALDTDDGALVELLDRGRARVRE